MRAVAPGSGGPDPASGGARPARGGRWIWAVSGVITAVVLGVLGVMLIARPGQPVMTDFASPQHSATRTVTVPQQVSGVTVDSYGAPVSVRSGDVSRVRVTETVMWSGTESAADVPAATQTVSGGQLTLASPRCTAASGMPGAAAASAPHPGVAPAIHSVLSESAAVPGGPVLTVTRPGAASRPRHSVPSAIGVASAGGAASTNGAVSTNGPVSAGSCEIAFNVTTPPGVHVTVSSAGGPVALSGAGPATVNSGGGFVSAVQDTGALTVTSDGGIIGVDGLTGALNANSGGGHVVAQGLSSPAATITTEGGAAFADYAAPPRTVTIRTDSGPVQLGVPGGPYALTADSDGGPETLGIPASATATRSITISTGGGMLVVGSPGTTGRPGISLGPGPASAPGGSVSFRLGSVSG
ncbi:MAG TPA: hypothetical protein VK817_09730 [Trebonia sp.]|jgi:hypothetical protein|nr:hypothetical protein [Trebonia sp.]